MSDHENPRPADRSDAETFARLQAGDPAADARIDLAAVRRALDDRLDTGSAQSRIAPPAPAPAGPARWVRIAAVAATVALVGSAAFVIGRQTGGTAPSAAEPASAAGAVGSLEMGSSASRPRQSPLTTSAASPAGGGAQASVSGADSKLIGGGYGRTHFSDGGLSTDGGSAQAWGFDPSSVINGATAERIAAAMGVSGSATVQYQTWVVGPSDGSGPSVSLAGDGQASVGYNDPQAYSTCSPDAGGPATGSASGVVEPCVTPVPVDITADDAIARADDVLTRIGLDPAGYTLTSPDDQAGNGYRSVVADRLVDGQDIGVQFWFSFVGDRLASFSGGLAPVVSLGQYPVISPSAAVARMNDPRFGTTSSSGPIDIMRTDMTVAEVPADEVPTPAAPVPGAALSWPVTEVTLTSASLGLSARYQADGSTLLVPTWTLTDTDRGSWSVIAVADDQLDLTG